MDKAWFVVVLIAMAVFGTPASATIIYMSGVDWGWWAVLIILSFIFVPVIIGISWIITDVKKMPSCNACGAKIGHKSTCPHYVYDGDVC